MMEELLKHLPNYGVLGIMFALLVMYLLKREKKHDSDINTKDAEIREMAKLAHKQAADNAEAYKEVVGKNTEAITKLGILIESRKK